MKHTRTRWSARKFALPALLILMALALVFAVSEPVRAKTLQWIRVVAGFSVEERSESPLQAVTTDQQPRIQAAGISSAGSVHTEVPSTPIVEPTVYSIPPLSAQEALQNPPFPFSLPTWVPDGYSLDDTAGVATSQTWVVFKWSNPNLSEIELLVELEYTGYKLPAGVDSSEEIQISGTPALLLRGFWDARHQWDPKRGISLDWVKDGHHYHLAYCEREALRNEIKPIEGDMEAIIQELVKMAESIP